jgi:hypothetical protein
MERRPVRAHPGVRQLWCPSYSRCLDDAIRQGWEGFSCELCEFRATADKTDVDPAFAIVSLCWAVLFPRKWSRFVAVAERFLKGERDPIDL